MEQMKFMLGILTERSEHTARAVDRIEERQLGIAQDIHEVRERVSVLESKAEAVPRLERLIKGILTYAAPLVTLWATGSMDKAMEVAKLIGSR